MYAHNVYDHEQEIVAHCGKINTCKLFLLISGCFYIHKIKPIIFYGSEINKIREWGMGYSIVLNSNCRDCYTKCIHVRNSVNLYWEFTKRTVKT